MAWRSSCTVPVRPTASTTSTATCSPIARTPRRERRADRARPRPPRQPHRGDGRRVRRTRRPPHPAPRPVRDRLPRRHSAVPDRRRRCDPDDRVAQDPADLAPGAVPHVAGADEDVVRPRSGRSRQPTIASCRSPTSRCNPGSTSTREAGRSLVVPTTTGNSPSGSPTSSPTSRGRCATSSRSRRASRSPTPSERANDARDGVVVLSDTGDSVLGGAGGDSTLLDPRDARPGIAGPALVPLVHPAIGDVLDVRTGR